MSQISSDLFFSTCRAFRLTYHKKGAFLNATEFSKFGLPIDINAQTVTSHHLSQFPINSNIIFLLLCNILYIYLFWKSKYPYVEIRETNMKEVSTINITNE